MLRFVFAVAILTGQASAAESPWDCLPTVQSSPAEPTWVIWKGDNSTPWNDVHSRIVTSEQSIHEACHLLMSVVANKWGCWANRQMPMYVMQGRIALLSEPPITVTDVAKAVPVSQRGQVYSTYLIDYQQTWNTNPLILLEEWCCYSNKWEHDGVQFGLDRAVEFSGYAAVLLTLAERCPNYDAAPLRTFVRWHTARVDAQVKAVKSKPAAVLFGRTTGACANGRCPQ